MSWLDKLTSSKLNSPASRKRNVPEGLWTKCNSCQSVLYRAIGLTWNLDIPVMTRQQIENRKIYNTGAYSQHNGGHRFTDVLTDNERRALIEYLKTL